VTVEPLGTPLLDDTVAVKVTDSLTCDGLGEEVTAVVVLIKNEFSCMPTTLTPLWHPASQSQPLAMTRSWLAVTVHVRNRNRHIVVFT
jgi:hypothetical protein